MKCNRPDLGVVEEKAEMLEVRPLAVSSLISRESVVWLATDNERLLSLDVVLKRLLPQSALLKSLKSPLSVLFRSYCLERV